MPAGALWQLYYADDIDHRIQARSDRQRFSQDRNVLTATLSIQEGYVLLEVQLADDTNVTFDESLRITFAQNSRPMFDHRRERREFNTEYQGQFYQPNPEPNPRPPVPPDIRERIISEYISTANGRQALAASMAAPLRRRMDYSSLARQTFMVEQLPDGALPIYGPDSEAGKVSDFKNPEWVEAGTWVKNEQGDYATIIYVKPAVTEPPYSDSVIEYSIWRGPGPLKNMTAERFCDQWLPSEPPQEPRTRFERILMDDD